MGGGIWHHPIHGYLVHTRFSVKKNGWWGWHLLPDILGQPAPAGAKSPILNRYSGLFARSASAVTSSEKSSINTSTKSTMHFPISVRWSSYVAPQPERGRGAQKCKTAIFLSKIALCLKKVCYKVTLCETVNNIVVRHSLA